MIKSLSQILLLFSLHFSSLNLKYFKLTKNGFNPFCDETLQYSHLKSFKNEIDFMDENFEMY